MNGRGERPGKSSTLPRSHMAARSPTGAPSPSARRLCSKQPVSCDDARAASLSPLDPHPPPSPQKGHLRSLAPGHEHPSPSSSRVWGWLTPHPPYLRGRGGRGKEWRRGEIIDYHRFVLRVLVRSRGHGVGCGLRRAFVRPGSHVRKKGRMDGGWAPAAEKDIYRRACKSYKEADGLDSAREGCRLWNGTDATLCAA